MESTRSHWEAQQVKGKQWQRRGAPLCHSDKPIVRRAHAEAIGTAFSARFGYFLRARPGLEPERVLSRALSSDQRILPAMHWLMNERWLLLPVAPSAPDPLCSESASHFSKLWTCASGAGAGALAAAKGIVPARQSRINWLWLRVLGPGPEPLC